MDNVFDEAQAILQCKSCPWYKSCVLPMRLTEEELRRQLESSTPGTSIPGASDGMLQLLSGMAAAAQNSLLEGCPVFIHRLRQNPELAQQLKKMMQEWSKENEEPGTQEANHE